MEGDQTWDIDALVYPYVTFILSLAQKRAALKREIDKLKITEFNERCLAASVDTNGVKRPKATDTLIDKELADDEKSSYGETSRQHYKSVNSSNN